MAIISCPSCKERVSNKSKSCPHCDFDFESGKSTDGLNEEQLANQEKLANLKKRYSLQMQAMAGIILFLFGFIMWYFVGKQGLSKLTHFIEIGLAVLGGVWYIITRIRLMAYKRSQK
ncbi:hypothetical protein [Aliikangiella sp. G2MR2-5]|uniref:hypothetical protein n=1 Tax=Aliikangiella sp. G2MR2-5 TaxID=2788943 RepID=UPI0018A936F6|nr:hypothetical protein [Aliikangiella sp. G2MR2-5]